MKKLFITSVLITLVSLCAIGQTKYATMRVSELNKANSLITIVYEDGKSEIIELEGIGLAGLNHAKLLENQKTITKTLNEMAEKGYELLSESTSSFGANNYKYTNYTFKKE